jgi:hypothetical protein
MGNPPNVALSTTLTASLVANTQALKSAINVDYRAEASFFGIGSSDFSANVSLDDSSDSQNLALVITATSFFPQMEVVNASLKPEFAQLLNSGNSSDAFSGRCGKEYVKSVDQLVSLSVIITLRQQAETTVSQIRGSGSGSLDLGVVSGDVTADVSKETSQIASSRQNDIQVYARGAGAADLANLTTLATQAVISNGTSIPTIETAITKLMVGMTTPVVGGYHVRPMSDFASTAPDNVFTQAKWDDAEAIADRFRQVREADVGVSAILLGNDLRSRLTTPAQMTQLRAQQLLYGPYEQALQNQYGACLKGVGIAIARSRLQERPISPLFLYCFLRAI